MRDEGWKNTYSMVCMDIARILGSLWDILGPRQGNGNAPSPFVKEREELVDKRPCMLDFLFTRVLMEIKLEGLWAEEEYFGSFIHVAFNKGQMLSDTREKMCTFCPAPQFLLTSSSIPAHKRHMQQLLKSSPFHPKWFLFPSSSAYSLVTSNLYGHSCSAYYALWLSELYQEAKFKMSEE